MFFFFTFEVCAAPLESSDESPTVIGLAPIDQNGCECDCDAWERVRFFEDALRINTFEVWGAATAVDCDCDDC